ncbi:PFL family protein [Changpingibacter yushuensis]|uniref:PFL family protein n=1 Tax=Changpingibacter yushuensis TaxID=2758440 RepID=UPI001C71572D|nr:PFL family protein [Changpingibacter yushuensis]
MAMDTAENILETINMIAEDRLDIRTVTMGISLLDCADSDGEKARKRCYDRITSSAANLVIVCEGIEAELGIPIINKRISITPISLVAAASGETDLVPWARMLDSAGKAVGVDFIGGFSALVEKGSTAAETHLMESIPESLATTDIVCSSVNIGSSRAGINMDAVAKMGQVVVDAAHATPGGLGAAKLVVFANSVGDNPFMAGAFHGVEMPDCVVSVGVSGPGVIKRAIDEVDGEPFDIVAEAVKKAAFKVTRMGELVGRLAAERLGVQFGIVDLSLAPTAEVGDSVARALEAMGLERVGAHGTTAALALLNDAVKKGGLMACSRVGGLSGSFIPVSEDEGMIEAAALGAITLSKLEAMTAICSVGLDMVAVPGDTPASSIAGMIADEAAIGIMNHKTTAVRVIPAAGTKEGDMVEFGGLLGKAPVMAVSPYSSAAFMARGGIIPSPVHGFRN